jgi:hypothetical protein
MWLFNVKQSCREKGRREKDKGKGMRRKEEFFMPFP